VCHEGVHSIPYYYCYVPTQTVEGASCKSEAEPQLSSNRTKELDTSILLREGVAMETKIKRGSAGR
jgi:hypothetical protein